MHIYVSSAMRKRRYYNYEAIDAAAATLRGQGHRVWSPADQDRAFGFDAMKCGHPNAITGDMPYEAMGLPPLKDLVALDMQHVLIADALVTLPEWWMSIGARAELFCAQFAGKQIYHLEANVLVADPWRAPDDFKFNDAVFR